MIESRSTGLAAIPHRTRAEEESARGLLVTFVVWLLGRGQVSGRGYAP
jgi:hypothetical protein